MFQENSIETCILSKVKSPAQVGCMRQVLRPGALGRPRGMGWRGRWEGGSGWGTHGNPWLIHVNVWQKPLQYCKVISLQLIKKKQLQRQCEVENVYLFPVLPLPDCGSFEFVSALLFSSRFLICATGVAISPCREFVSISTSHIA